MSVPTVDLLLPESDGNAARFAMEVLDHLRVPYRCLPPDGSVVPEAPVLVVADAVPMPMDAVDRLTGWLHAGGRALLYGGTGSLETALGVTQEPVTQPGYLTTNAGDERFAVAGWALAAADSRVIARWADGRTAALELSVGAGVVEIWGIQVWRSIVEIMQGRPVSGPGPSAPDGTAPRVDGVLRCGDGLTLPYTDRQLPPGHDTVDPFPMTWPVSAAAPVFARARADEWRVSFLEGLRRLTVDRGTPLAWLHYWPAGTPAVAHMSHDSDNNQDSHARAALAAFDKAGVSVTWCHCHPGGYSAELVAAIAAAGHEQALHYNAMGDTPQDVWGRNELIAQHRWAEALCDARIRSNKNHFTRWEGYDEFYAWCVDAGIQIDETRGAAKQGDAGFTFGTAHPWFPLAADAATAGGAGFYDVLEIPLHTQDLTYAMHPAVRDVILDEVLRVHGVAHFLFHGTHIEGQPGVAEQVVDVAGAARRLGMPWWTAGQINDWERARRRVHLTTQIRGKDVRVSVHSKTSIRELGVVVELPDADRPVVATDESGLRLQAETTSRHGRPVLEVRLDVDAGTTRTVEISSAPSEAQQAAYAPAFVGLAEPIRLGILGLESSHVDHVLRHVNAECRFDGVTVTALLRDTPDDRVAALLDIAEADVVEEFDTLLDRVDAVIDCTRDGRLHRARAEAALGAGRAMYIDKPLATSESDARAIVDLALARELPFSAGSAVPCWLRADPEELAAARVIELSGHADPDSPWAGIFFYGAHLTELAVQLAGVTWSTPPTVTKSADGITANVLLGGRHVDLMFSPDATGFEARLTLPDGRVRTYPIALGEDYYLPVVERFVATFRTGAWPLAPDQLTAPIRLLEQIADRL